MSPLEIVRKDRASVDADFALIEAWIDDAITKIQNGWRPLLADVGEASFAMADLEIALTGDCEAVTALADILIENAGDEQTRTWLACEFRGDCAGSTCARCES